MRIPGLRFSLHIQVISAKICCFYWKFSLYVLGLLKDINVTFATLFELGQSYICFYSKETKES